MKLTRFGGHTAPKREAFWNDLYDALCSCRKLGGKYTYITEHEGQGSEINIDDTVSRRGGGGGPTATGACCSGTWPSLVCSVGTAAACAALGGNYLGDGTDCSGRDCNSGACCEFFGDHTCRDANGEFLCDDCSPGRDCWMGYGTACATTRCVGACCCAGGTSTGWLLNGNCITNDCCYFFPACCDGGSGCVCTDSLTYGECQSGCLTEVACCISGACSMMIPSDCSDAGGLSGGTGSTCDGGNPCGRCCCGSGDCHEAADGGANCTACCPVCYWMVGGTCGSDPCDGSCCDGADCFITDATTCTAKNASCVDCADGYSFSIGVSCIDGNPCCPDPTTCQACCFASDPQACVPHWGTGCVEAGGTYVDHCCLGDCVVCHG